MQIVAWVLFSKSTKQKKNFRSLFDVFWMSRAERKPGYGRKMCATSRSVASAGTPSTYRQEEAFSGTSNILRPERDFRARSLNLARRESDEGTEDGLLGGFGGERRRVVRVAGVAAVGSHLGHRGHRRVGVGIVFGVGLVSRLLMVALVAGVALVSLVALVPWVALVGRRVAHIWRQAQHGVDARVQRVIRHLAAALTRNTRLRRMTWRKRGSS